MISVCLVCIENSTKKAYDKVIRLLVISYERCMQPHLFVRKAKGSYLSRKKGPDSRFGVTDKETNILEIGENAIHE